VMYGLIAQTLLERTTAEWLELFRELEIPAAPIQTPDELFDDPHLNAVGLFETVDTKHGPVRFPGVPTWFSRTPGRVAGPAPELGADTAEVLAEVDTLGERQLRAVVDGVGSPPPVGLPGVGP
jgi:crotonobetainyl-CoA:carnitine CoA-transferase CaiB-like acyl-CoA transferase